MRIGGIASGMDTEQMVKDLMRAERVRVDKLFRQEESLKWKREALNTTNKTLAEFILKARNDFGLTTKTNTGSILNKSSQSFDWVKKVSSSDESAIKATATASAMEGTHKIKVEKLAEVASVTSGEISGLLNEDGSFKSEAYGDIIIKTKTGEVKITIGTGKDEVKTINQLVSAMNNAKVGEEGKEVSLGLRAAYDSSLGKMMINTKEQGEEQEIEISGDLTEKFFAAKDLVVDPNDATKKILNAKGVNASIVFNGDKVEKSSNNFSMFGVNYELQSSDINKEITINVESNVDGIMGKVKGFVEDYNKLIDNINDQLKQKSYRDFNPLTKEEKEAMKEKEIELWEEKAKSGLLRGDETLTRVLQTMRDGLYGSVYEEGLGESGKKLSGFSHLTQIGVTTGSYQSGGKLEIDEKKLRQKIIDNPDGVIDLLFKKSSIDVKDKEGNVDNAKVAEKRANSGIIERLFDDMVIGMKEVVRRSGTGEDKGLFDDLSNSTGQRILIDFVTSGSISVMDRDIMNIGKRISNEERILAGRENRYWRQFTAMEKAMEKMNQQSGWLQSQLAQMG